MRIAVLLLPLDFIVEISEFVLRLVYLCCAFLLDLELS